MPPSHAADGPAAAHRLGAPRITGMVMSSVTPMTVALLIITGGFAVTGSTAIPLGFLVVPAILAVFLVGFLAMARDVHSPGALYAYAAKVHPYAGVSAAFVALLAYNLLQIGLYGAIGDVVNPLLSSLTGTQLHWAGWAIIGLVVVTVMGLLRITITSGVLLAVLVADVAWLTVTMLVLLAHPAEGTTLASTLDAMISVDNVEVALAGGLTVNVLAFVGFEVGPVYAPRARTARSMPVAMRWVIGALTVIYLLVALAVLVAVGPANLAQAGPDMLYSLVEPHFDLWGFGPGFGVVWVQTGKALLAIGVITALISFYVTIGQYVYSLSERGILPSRLGRLSARTSAPAAALLLQSALALGVVLVFAYNGWDPYKDLLIGFGAHGALGILLLLNGVSIAVAVHFHRHPGQHNLWTRRIAPITAAVLLALVLAAAVWKFETILGDPDSPWATGGPALVFTVAALAALGGKWLRRNKPDAYARIGTGTSRSIAPTAEVTAK